METADLTAPEYWDDLEPDVRFNPVGSPSQEGLMDFVRKETRLAGHVLLATSGTRDRPKWIAVSKQAILDSGKAVNAHLKVERSDRWLLALPDFHVGGMGVFARGFLADIPVSVFEQRWRTGLDGFLAQSERENITLTALTPTQVFDLVRGQRRAPGSLRAVVVGGGGLDLQVGEAARSLGWPVLQSYGMTEASSQIGTESLEALVRPFSGCWLPLLPHWEARIGERERLEIRGDSLFSGTVSESAEGGWKYEPVPLTGDRFFVTSDRVALRDQGRGTELQFLGRSDDLVKVLGELVSLGTLRNRWEAILGQSGDSGTLVAVPDERNSHRLVGIIEGKIPNQTVGEKWKSIFNSQVAPFERIDRLEWVAELPRTAIGKIAMGRLLQDGQVSGTAGN